MDQRWSEHVYNATKKRSNGHFYRAIRKHGVGCWTHEVLVSGIETHSVACQEEVRLVSELDAFRSGYNDTPGGDGVVSMSPEARELHRAATSAGTKRAYRDPAVRQRHLEAVRRPETRKNNSESQRVAKSTPESRAKNSAAQALAAKRPETKLKRSLAQSEIQSRDSVKLAKSLAHRKGVQQLDPQTRDVLSTYESATQAAMVTGFNRSGICHCARGETF